MKLVCFYICATTFIFVLTNCEKDNESLNYRDGLEEAASLQRRRRSPKKTYYVRKEEATWKEAVEKCKAEDKSLASVRGRGDLRALVNLRKDKGVDHNLMWIGGYYDEASHQYLWVGEPATNITFTNWFIFQPKPDHGTCIEINPESKWLTYHCEFKYFYVCESDD